MLNEKSNKSGIKMLALKESTKGIPDGRTSDSLEKKPCLLRKARFN